MSSLSSFLSRMTVAKILLLTITPLLLQQQQIVYVVNGHVRIECPPPLSGNTDEKVGPCDVLEDDFSSTPAFELIPNSLNTITWLESISHPGAPTRFALSSDVIENNDNSRMILDSNIVGNSFESCILLDHVPHDAYSQPNYRNESSWHRSSITLWIPDIKCERCYLQLISVMSDVQHGVPSNTKCIYEGTAKVQTATPSTYPICPAVYHSCSPVTINGTIPRNSLETCHTMNFNDDELQWPLTPKLNADLYEPSVYYNRGDVGIYSYDGAHTLTQIGTPLTNDQCTSPNYCDPQTSFVKLMDVPQNAPYTTMIGECSIVATEMIVEPYKPGGILPSTPKQIPMIAPKTVTTTTTTSNISIGDDDDRDHIKKSFGDSLSSGSHHLTTIWAVDAFSALSVFVFLPTVFFFFC